MNTLAWLGRHATAALATGILLGLIVPGLSSIMPPLLPFIIFIFVVASILKVDPYSMSGMAVRPLCLLMSIAWVLIFSAIAIALLLAALAIDPELAQAILLWAASPPMTAAILFAALLRLDVTLAASACLAGLILVPVSGPVVVWALSDLHLSINPVALILRTIAFIGAAAVVALLVRHALGERRLARFDDEVSGLTVVVLLIYAATLMSSARDIIFFNVVTSITYVIAACLLNLLLQLLTFVVFAGQPPLTKTTAALLAGNRNMGVLYANLGSAVTPEIILFFAATHLPVYVFPYLLKPVYARASAYGSGSEGNLPTST